MTGPRGRPQADGFSTRFTSRQIIGAEIVVQRRTKEGDAAARNDWAPAARNLQTDFQRNGASRHASFLCFQPMISLFRSVPATMRHGGAMRLHRRAKPRGFSLAPMAIAEVFLRKARQFNSITARFC